MSLTFPETSWALVLGGSSGFGLATARKLARHGMSIAVVHRDRRGAMDRIEKEFADIRSSGAELLTFNVDALSPSGRGLVLDELTARLGASGRVRLLLHSIAYGNLKLLAPAPVSRGSSRACAQLADLVGVSESSMTQMLEAALLAGVPEVARLIPPSYGELGLLEEEDFARTVNSMGTSLASWTQDVFTRGLFAASARVIGLTSEGNELVWRGYAAVAAAKAALEAVIRAIAVEFAPYGVRANTIQAGVTETPALALIPGSAHMKASASLRNPSGRLTRPEDVANVIALLCTDEAEWVNGALLRVDGGERIGA